MAPLRMLLVLGAVLSAGAKFIGIRVYDDYKCSTGSILSSTTLWPSPYCVKGNGKGSVEIAASDGPSDTMVVTGFFTNDCSIADGGGSANASLIAAASFVNLGVAPTGICMLFDATFAAIIGKKSYYLVIFSTAALACTVVFGLILLFSPCIAWKIW